MAARLSTRPALPNFHHVPGLYLWDRYVASALAYRAVDLAHGHSLIDMAFVEAINRPFPEPDFTVLIDIPPSVSAARATRGGRAEPYSTEHLERVRQKYLSLMTNLPCVIIDGERDPEEVAQRVAVEIRARFTEFFDEP